MKPEIKSLFSTDLNKGELPDNPSDCSVLVEANIGAEAEEGSEIFSFYVVTASFLEKASKPRWGRGYLVVDFFSWDVVEVSINKLLRHCNGNNWDEISAKLSKELYWEFDNYKE